MSSPIHIAAKNDNVMAIPALISAGFSINALDIENKDNSPLHYARTAAMVDALLAQGANLHYPNRDGITPLHQAIKNENVEVLNALVAAGADPNARDPRSGNNALHFAVIIESSDEILNALIAGNADLNARNNQGDSPLHLAIHLQREERVMRFLIAAGTNPGLVNDSGQTPRSQVVNNPELSARLESQFNQTRKLLGICRENLQALSMFAPQPNTTHSSLNPTPMDSLKRN
jgi:ankyrin repeat protein